MFQLAKLVASSTVVGTMWCLHIVMHAAAPAPYKDVARTLGFNISWFFFAMLICKSIMFAGPRARFPNCSPVQFRYAFSPKVPPAASAESAEPLYEDITASPPSRESESESESESETNVEDID